MTSIGRFLVIVVVGLILVNSGVSAEMFGFGKKYEVQLFPEVEGRVTMNGLPLEGVTVFRESTYDKVEAQETQTGPDGQFSFPAWTIQSRTPGKPFVEDRMRQVVAVEYDGGSHLLWYYVTGRVEGEKVVAEKLRLLNCDLVNEEVTHRFASVEDPAFTHNVSSICRW